MFIDFDSMSWLFVMRIINIILRDSFPNYNFKSNWIFHVYSSYHHIAIEVSEVWWFILVSNRSIGKNRGMSDWLGYALSHLGNVHTGTPERPLSTQGLLCYRKYWTAKIFDYLLKKTNEEQIVINGEILCLWIVRVKWNFVDISKATSISTCDIIETLASLNMIRMLEKDKLIIYRSQVGEQREREEEKVWLVGIIGWTCTEECDNNDRCFIGYCAIQFEIFESQINTGDVTIWKSFEKIEIRW